MSLVLLGILLLIHCRVKRPNTVQQSSLVARPPATARALFRTSGSPKGEVEGMANFSSMTYQQKLLFEEIQDVIGPAEMWPRQVLYWFHNGIPSGQGTSCKKRPLFTAFFWVNGLNPEVLYDWCKLKPNSHPHAAVTHYQWLFSAFNRGDLNYLYSWNICQGRYENLNGVHYNRK